MEQWATIRYLHAQGKGVREIARELSLARQTVRRALESGSRPQYTRTQPANRQLASFEAQVRELYFSKHLIGSRILRELRKSGYTGGKTALYDYLHSLKQPQLSEKVTMRFETEPGQQAQFDWSPYTVELGGQLKRIAVYGMTLGYSRRKHYTASLDERQGSIFEAIEECWWHFGGTAKELLVDNPRAFVIDANPKTFRWNPQFLELCGHYRVKPRACLPYRARTKGKIERPFDYLEEQFIKGSIWQSLGHLLEELARFERDDLDLRVHSTTRERPIDRFAAEQPHLTPLPPNRFVGTLALTRHVSWDCLVSFEGNRYSVPATYAGKMVWLLVSHGQRLVVLSSRRELLVEHELSAGKGQTIILPEHYEPLRRRGTPRTYVRLAEAFLTRFPHHAQFLEGLTAQYKIHPEFPLRAVMELAGLYDDQPLSWAFDRAVEFNTYSARFLRGLLESHSQPDVPTSGPPEPASVRPATTVRANLGAYQQVLELGQ
ncbi:MAG: IS21 family transposase [Chloroflexota bacterium]|nr:IS21 family transposase [Chloroflexota bacterium]